MTPVLTTDRLFLGLPDASHIAAHATWAASDRATALGWHQAAHMAWREFASVAGHHALNGYGPFVAERRNDGVPVGLFGLWYPPATPDIELKWTLWDPASEGTGLAHEAMIAVRDHARNKIGLAALVSFIDPENTRSQALARRLGAVQDGTWQTPTGKTVGVWRHPAVRPTFPAVSDESPK